MHAELAMILLAYGTKKWAEYEQKISRGQSLESLFRALEY
jgi:hypothetical protein